MPVCCVSHVNDVLSRPHRKEIVANLCLQEWLRMRSSSGERRSLILQSWSRSKQFGTVEDWQNVFEGGAMEWLWEFIVDHGANGGFSRVASPVLVLKALVLKIRYLVVPLSYLYMRVLLSKATNDHPGLHPHPTPPRSEFGPHYLGTSLIREEKLGTKNPNKSWWDIYELRSLMERLVPTIRSRGSDMALLLQRSRGARTVQKRGKKAWVSVPKQDWELIH